MGCRCSRTAPAVPKSKVAPQQRRILFEDEEDPADLEESRPLLAEFPTISEPEKAESSPADAQDVASRVRAAAKGAKDSFEKFKNSKYGIFLMDRWLPLQDTVLDLLVTFGREGWPLCSQDGLVWTDDVWWGRISTTLIALTYILWYALTLPIIWKQIKHSAPHPRLAMSMWLAAGLPLLIASDFGSLIAFPTSYPRQGWLMNIQRLRVVTETLLESPAQAVLQSRILFVKVTTSRASLTWSKLLTLAASVGTSILCLGLTIKDIYDTACAQEMGFFTCLYRLLLVGLDLEAPLIHILKVKPVVDYSSEGQLTDDHVKQISGILPACHSLKDIVFASGNSLSPNSWQSLATAAAAITSTNPELKMRYLKRDEEECWSLQNTVLEFTSMPAEEFMKGILPHLSSLGIRNLSSGDSDEMLRILAELAPTRPTLQNTALSCPTGAALLCALSNLGPITLACDASLVLTTSDLTGLDLKTQQGRVVLERLVKAVKKAEQDGHKVSLTAQSGHFTIDLLAAELEMQEVTAQQLPVVLGASAANIYLQRPDLRSAELCSAFKAAEGRRAKGEDFGLHVTLGEVPKWAHQPTDLPEQHTLRVSGDGRPGLQDARNILRAFRHCDNLRRILCLSFSAPAADIIQWLPFIPEELDLQLRIESQHGGDDDCQQIVAGLQRLPKLRTLQLILKGSSIGDDGCKQLSDGLKPLASLQHLHLDLALNKIGPNCCHHLGDAVKQLTLLQELHLNLYQNGIGDDGCKQLSDGLKPLASLQHLHLDLRGNKIGHDGCKQLSDGLKPLASLQHLHLDLGENAIGDDGCKQLSDGLKPLASLQHLHLNLCWNEIGGDGCKQLSDGLKPLASLQHLHLDLKSNKIGDEQKAREMFNALPVEKKELDF